MIRVGCVIALSIIGRLKRSCMKNILRLYVKNAAGTSGCLDLTYLLARAMTDSSSSYSMSYTPAHSSPSSNYYKTQTGSRLSSPYALCNSLILCVCSTAL